MAQQSIVGFNDRTGNSAHDDMEARHLGCLSNVQ